MPRRLELAAQQSQGLQLLILCNAGSSHQIIFVILVVSLTIVTTSLYQVLVTPFTVLLNVK